MLCNCSVDACDTGYGNDVECEEWPRARKEWVCVECRETIKPGERYQLFSVLFDGHWSKDRTCAPCARIRKDLCRCWYPGGLRAAIQECLGFDYLAEVSE